MNVVPLVPRATQGSTVRCVECYGEGSILMLGHEERCSLCAGAGWYRPSPRHVEPTVTDALAMWSAWHLDVPPCDATGEFSIDMRLADAFRMLIFLRHLDARWQWLEREVFDRSGGLRKADKYAAVLTRWWLQLYQETTAG